MTEPRYPYVHVHVSEEEADLLAAELFELGAQGVEQRDGTTLDAPVGSAGATLIASFPDEAGAHAAAEALSDYGAEVAFVVGDEWRDGWKKYFKPSRVGQRFVVRPSWEPWDAQPEDVVIEIDPGRAFGSGIHETTRLVLTVIDGHMEEGVRVLDVGCGSGILAIGAVLRGAVHADCIDNDADVIPVTLENAEINGVAERIAASATPVGELSGRYDWVLANIEARILVPLARDIAARVKPGGWLVLSGVLDGQQGEVLGAYPGFSLASERRENDWVALLLRAESPGS
ncbi:MAG: 50S ribosomal protein L11 methyltransferase [Myxococcales bacterium]|nr:50S ribosomal protein L11 methyltransferase [Myxococcales bacterium]